MYGQRRGFRLVTFDGAEAVIAARGFAKAQRVSKYSVDVAAIDVAVEKALAPPRGVHLYLVDEIGKMEYLSPRFVTLMRRVLTGTGPLWATVAQRGAAFIAEVKRREDWELWTLTRANRDAIAEQIGTWIAQRREASAPDKNHKLPARRKVARRKVLR